MVLAQLTQQPEASNEIAVLGRAVSAISDDLRVILRGVKAMGALNDAEREFANAHDELRSRFS